MPGATVLDRGVLDCQSCPIGGARRHSIHLGTREQLRPELQRSYSYARDSSNAQQTSTMASLRPTKQPNKEHAGLRYPSSGKTIYHRPLNRSKTSELSQASFAYLFSEMVSYAQRRVTGIQDLEKR
jgi:hypothetical protein